MVAFCLMVVSMEPFLSGVSLILYTFSKTGTQCSGVTIYPFGMKPLRIEMHDNKIFQQRM